MENRQELRVLYCECQHASVLGPEAKEAVRRGLTDAGVPWEAVPDLCELAARKAPLLSRLAGSPTLAVAACHPRAVRWLFAAAGAELPEQGVTYLDMRSETPEQLLRTIETLTTQAGGFPQPATAAPLQPDKAAGAPAWQPWFPVLDYSRCENCQQCLGFCLFGVYTAAPDGRVQVTHPANCKNFCPACARVCPSAAIIFPKYPNAPINGGEVEEGAPVEPLQVDKVALLSGDTLKILQQRGRHALLFAKGSDEFRALQERLTHAAASGRPLPLLKPNSPAPPSPEEPS